MAVEEAVLKQRIVTEAYRWIDTPYRHQASLHTVGADCLGLIRGVWREIYGSEPAPIPPYTPDWAEARGEETLLIAAQNYLTEIDFNHTLPGHVMLFRMSADAPCKHIAIKATDNTIIHAYWGRAVVESYLVPYWQKRHVYSFAFPELESFT